jgi:hypothetical protein
VNFGPDEWEPPRCVHGRILLGCPHVDCPTQLAYLDQQNAVIAAWHQRQQDEAREIVRSLLGLPA